MQACVVLALAILVLGPVQESITLEVRTFDGPNDVSELTRVVVHRAGDREQPVGRVNIGPNRTVSVSPGIYDAQAIREQSGRVVNIRWAERLVVMPYPDEKGHHLEVVNFQTGYGALEIRDKSGRRPEADVGLFPPKDHSRPVALPVRTPTSALFVVRAGEYDVFVMRGARGSWHPGIDVPLNRTRLWIVPDAASPGTAGPLVR
jgi:hypothetical protein